MGTQEKGGGKETIQDDWISAHMRPHYPRPLPLRGPAWPDYLALTGSRIGHQVDLHLEKVWGVAEIPVSTYLRVIDFG